MRVVRLNESQLRKIIAEEMNQAFEQPMAGKGPTASMKVKDHLNKAKAAVSEMLQDTQSSRATDGAQALVASINRTIALVDRVAQMMGAAG